MSEKPFFSVVIPVYNKEPHIARAINSVLNQTFRDFEIVIVCDPSTDNSNAEVAKFTDSRIRVFYRDVPGAGGYAARNLGIKESKAEWIAFLDVDDEWYPYFLEKNNVFIKNNPQDKIFTMGWMDSFSSSLENESRYFNKNKNKGLHYIHLDDYIESSIGFSTPVHTNVIVINKKLLTKDNIFPEAICRRGGDVALWLKLIYLNGKITFIPEIGAIYHRENSTVTKELAPELENNCIFLTVNHIKSQIYNKSLKNKLLRFANFHIRYALFSRIKSGTLTYHDVVYHDFKVDFFYHVFLMMFAFIPKKIQSKIYALIKRYK